MSAVAIGRPMRVLLGEVGSSQPAICGIHLGVDTAYPYSFSNRRIAGQGRGRYSLNRATLEKPKPGPGRDIQVVRANPELPRLPYLLPYERP